MGAPSSPNGLTLTGADREAGGGVAGVRRGADPPVGDRGGARNPAQPCLFAGERLPACARRRSAPRVDRGGALANEAPAAEVDSTTERVQSAVSPQEALDSGRSVARIAPRASTPATSSCGSAVSLCLHWPNPPRTRQYRAAQAESLFTASFNSCSSRYGRSAERPNRDSTPSSIVRWRPGPLSAVESFPAAWILQPPHPAFGHLLPRRRGGEGSRLAALRSPQATDDHTRPPFRIARRMTREPLH